MLLLALFLIINVLGAPSTDILKPKTQHYDLEDEAREQVEDLRSIVRGAISSALNSIDMTMRQMYSFRNYAMLSATSAVLAAFQTFTSEITTLKNMAQTTEHSIDICLENNEPLLNNTYEGMLDILWECLRFTDREMSKIQKESNYRIDTLINEVNIFDFHLDLCGGDFMCMSPLITEIELAVVRIPQKIGLEVKQAEELCTELKVLIVECMDSKVAHFNAEAGTIVTEISSCVNNILS